VREASEKLKGKVRVVKINLQKNHQTAMALGVRVVPTLVLLSNGVEKSRNNGFGSAEEIAAWAASQ
jgi:thioredoxin-like negative regulator of GroEL